MNEKYSDLHFEAIELAWQLKGINKKITKEEDFSSEEILEKLKRLNKDLGFKFFVKKDAVCAELFYISRILPKKIFIVLSTPAGNQELEKKLPQIIENFKQIIELFNYDSGVKYNPESHHFEDKNINCEP